MQDPSQQPPHEPASPVPPLDYRPRTVDGAARHWMLWAGLAIVTVFVAVAVFIVAAAVLLTRHVAVISNPVPATISPTPATVGVPAMIPATSQPTTGQSSAP